MSKELIYTSAPRGLVPGSSGFCTVAMTEGLPTSWRQRLEALSTYVRHYPPDDPRNPVVYSHLRVNGKHVLSRIAEAGTEHTGRTNHLAHHLLLDDGDPPAAGPAWLLSRPGLFVATWAEEARWLEGSRAVPNGDAPPRVCRAWEHATGDAGWGGVLAEAFLSEPERPAVVVYDAGQELLPLFAEAMALLPPERRWEVTFSTYFTGLVPGLTCLWRGVLRGTEKARDLRRAGHFVIDLADTADLPEGPLVEAARTGRAAQPVKRRTQAVRTGNGTPRRAVPLPVPPLEDDVATEDADADAPPPPMVMPPLPGVSSGRGSLLLTAGLFALLGAAVGGVAMWAVQRPKTPPPDLAAADDQRVRLENERDEAKRGRDAALEEAKGQKKGRDSAFEEIKGLKKRVEEQEAKLKQQEAKLKGFEMLPPDWQRWLSERAKKHQGQTQPKANDPSPAPKRSGSRALPEEEKPAPRIILPPRFR